MRTLEESEGRQKCLSVTVKKKAKKNNNNDEIKEKLCVVEDGQGNTTGSEGSNSLQAINL